MLDNIYNILKTVKKTVCCGNTWDSALQHTSNIITRIDGLLHYIESEIEDETEEKNAIIDEVCSFLQAHKSIETSK